jgi:hypothetical protein
MVEEAVPAPAPSQAELRGTLREYVKWTLYERTPRGVAPPPLSHPQRDAPAFTEADVYAARPGAADPRIADDGGALPRPLQALGGGAVLVHGPSDHNPVLQQASHAEGWRRFLAAQGGAAPGTLHFERDTVLMLASRLRPRDQQAIWDIKHRTVAEAAVHHHCSQASVKSAARDALDRLLDLLYASTGKRVA